MSTDGTVRRVLADEKVANAAGTVLRFAPDVARMVYSVMRDPRIPTRAKLEAAGCLGLLAVPFEALPVIGELEVAAVVTLAMGRLVAGVDEDLLRANWPGTDAGFSAFLVLANVGFRPRKALRHFALSRIATHRS